MNQKLFLLTNQPVVWIGKLEEIFTLLKKQKNSKRLIIFATQIDFLQINQIVYWK